MIARLVAAALVVAGIPRTGRAQVIRIHAVEAGSTRPVPGAIVRLIDSTGRTVGQGLTTESGRVSLVAPARGTFRLRADRIGHHGLLGDPFVVTDTVAVQLSMPPDRIVLPELTVAVASDCDARPDVGDLATLWEEIRKALTANRLGIATGATELTVRRYRRYRTLSGALRADTAAREFTTRASPFVSLSPGDLWRGGLIRATGDGYRFHGPDVEALLSDEFAASHCFELVQPGRRAPELVGLGFRPQKGTRLSDIEGVLWVDRSTAALRHLEFQYTRVPDPIRVAGLGGRIEFDRLADGSWIIAEWYLRTPERVRMERVSRALRRTTVQDTVVGFIDEGGTAAARGGGRLEFAERVAEVRRTTTMVRELRGRVMGTSGAAVEGALVAVVGADSVIATRPDGSFEVRDLPDGPIRVQVRALGYLALAVELGSWGDRPVRDTTLVLKAAPRVLDSLVAVGTVKPFVAGKMEAFERRRQAGFGRFLTRAELADPLRGGLDMQLRRFGRIALAPLPWECGGGYAAAAWDRGPGPVIVQCGGYSLPRCFLAVYLDGVLIWSPDMRIAPPDLSDFNTLTLEGAELYRTPSETPVEFSGTGALCGVIVLWTRV